MKVVHVVSKDVGGAARAVIRINSALRQQGVDTKVLVLNKNTNEDDIQSLFTSKLAWNVFRAVRKINDIKMKKYGLQGKFYRGKIGIDLSKQPLIQEADVINLHWINDGMLTVKGIEKLASHGKKIVWTMHDMFSFTAGCYYDGGCGRYETGCHGCPFSGGKIEVEKFIENQFRKKAEVYRKVDIRFVGCSKWIAESARKSPLTMGNPVVDIANPIDTNIFKPVDKSEAIKSFGIVTNKKIILFGAMSSDSDPRKGFKYLHQTIDKLDSEKYLLVVFGNNNSIQIDSRFEIIGVGRVNADSELIKLYSMADVFVAPSTQENLSNAVMEALACGTPVVAFDVGGMKDLIDHEHSGYLAEPFEVDDLKYGIQWAAENKRWISAFCREKVEEHFSFYKIGDMYRQLYEIF